MSYILDALRKAERDRSLGQVPSLANINALPKTPKQHLWFLVIALTLVANAGTLALIHLLSEDHPVASEKSVIFSSTDQPASQSVDPLPSTLTDDSSGMESKHTSEIPESEPFLRHTPSGTVATIPATREAWPPSALRTLSGEFRQSLPTINIDVHVYSEAPEKRFVLINSKHYREGDQLDEGPFLEAIISDGAVLRYRDQTFVISVRR